MGLGHDHYMKILTELHKKGITLNNEELRELKLIANKIDDLYQTILDNQAAFGTPKIHSYKDYYAGPIPTYHPGTGEFTGTITLDEMLGGAKLVSKDETD